ncbi:site-2 protease family protein [bacterium]|nr:site-2 protease family protein [bacterium]
MNRRPTLRVGGIPIRMDLSWAAITVVVVVLIGFRVSWDGASGAVSVGAGVFGAVLLVLAVAFHELAHALAARRRGIPVSGVTLFVYGGFTEMGGDPADPGDEMAVAIAGPVASLALAAVLLAARLAVGRGAFGDVLGLMAVVNLGVAGFNLLPGLPLDGGRVLGSLVWRWTGDPERGTVMAVRSGQVTGVLLAIAGVAVLAIGRESVGLWGVAAGWFLAHAASAAGRISGKAGSPVSAVMIYPGHAVAHGDIVGGARDAPLPVIDAGRVVGVVPVGAASGVVAGRVMTPVDRGDVFEASEPIGKVLRRVARTGRPAVVVAGGRMLGVAPEEAIRAFLEG